MMTPEIQAIFDSLPQYILLTPGQKRRVGDEEYEDGPRGGWYPILDYSNCLGDEITKDDIVRRPIPREVREAQAWWALAERLLGKSILAPLWKNIEMSSLKQAKTYAENEIRYSRGDDTLKALGGESKVIEMLTAGPGAFEKWVMEGRV